MNKTKQYFIITGLLFMPFVIFTFATKVIDVRTIGLENSYQALQLLINLYLNFLV